MPGHFEETGEAARRHSHTLKVHPRQSNEEEDLARVGPAEIVFLLAIVALPLVGVVDAALIPASAFESAGRSKRFWILIQVFLGYIGAVIYFAAIRADVRFFTVPPSPDWEDETEASLSREERLGRNGAGFEEVTPEGDQRDDADSGEAG